MKKLGAMPEALTAAAVAEAAQKLKDGTRAECAWFRLVAQKRGRMTSIPPPVPLESCLQPHSGGRGGWNCSFHPPTRKGGIFVGNLRRVTRQEVAA